jgi:hypothetical protein
MLIDTIFKLGKIQTIDYQLFIYLFSFYLIEERMLFFISWNVCTAAYPPPLGFSCVGFWRRVGGSTVFHEGFFLFFF